jgi:hypothetical protein
MRFTIFETMDGALLCREQLPTFTPEYLQAKGECSEERILTSTPGTATARHIIFTVL